MSGIQTADGQNGEKHDGGGDYGRQRHGAKERMNAVQTSRRFSHPRHCPVPLKAGEDLRNRRCPDSVVFTLLPAHSPV